MPLPSDWAAPALITVPAHAAIEPEATDSFSLQVCFNFDDIGPVAESIAEPPPGQKYVRKDPHPLSPNDHPGILLHTGPSPFSGHHLDSFNKCPTLWALRYGMEGVITRDYDRFSAASKGTMGHIGLAHFYARAWAEQQGEDPEMYVPWDEAIRRLAWSKGGSWIDFVPTAIRTVGAYLDYWIRIRRDLLQVLGVEHVFDFQAAGITTFPHTRSCDLVVRERDGKVYLWDHKFVGRINADVRKRYILDGQFMDYQLLGYRLWGKNFGGARLNLVRWPDNNGEILFERSLIGAAPHALSRRPITLEWVNGNRAQAKAAAAKDPMAMWNLPMTSNEQVCKGPYGMCSAFDLCRYGQAQSPVHARLAVLPGG